MSIPVELPDLAQAIARYRFAYLLTGSAQGAPHAVAVVPVLRDGVLVVGKVGRRTRENLLARPAVGLVWPPQSEDDHSLIVDGQAALDGESARITPTRAVLHRPAPHPRVDPAADRAARGDPAAGPAAAGTCGSDCVELAVPAAVGSIIGKGGV
ncbi:MAG TPA: hypothetical protein PKA20_11530 [Burkholderiaceae bacterium]|nr:hypothetical protein [Burkholderiaceae bacterium]